MIEDIVSNRKDSPQGKFLFDIFSLIEFFANLGNCRDNITYPYISQDLPMLSQIHLVNYLNKVRETHDFLHANKQFLGKQMVNILSLFQGGVDENISQMAIDLVEDSVSSCVDKTTFVTDTLDMLTKQKKAIESGDTNELRKVAKHNIIIGMSDAISMQHEGDQIENMLQARIAVREKFNLPQGVQSMAFWKLSGFGFNKQDLEKIKESSTDEEVDKFIAFGKLDWNEFQKTKIFLPKFEELPIKPLDEKEMPECCLTNKVYDEMVEYKDEYYGYETLLTIYRNKQKITDRSELVDPSDIHRVVLTKDANT